MNGGIINVRDFGAVGDGKANDTDAVNSAIKHGNSLAAQEQPRLGYALYFPRGCYRVGGTLEELRGSVRLYGDGIGVSRLKWVRAATTMLGGVYSTAYNVRPALLFRSMDDKSGQGIRDSVTMHDIDLEAACPNAGYAISIVMDRSPVSSTDPIFPTRQNVSSVYPNVSIRNVRVWSDDQVPKHYWRGGIHMHQCWLYDIESFTFIGSPRIKKFSSGKKPKPGQRYQSYQADRGILVGESCTDGHIRKTEIAFAEIGIDTLGYFEGFRISDCTVLYAMVGVRWVKTDEHPIYKGYNGPHFVLHNSHIAVGSNCVSIRNANNIFISHCLFYQLDHGHPNSSATSKYWIEYYSEGGPTGGPVPKASMITLENVGSAQISDNYFVGSMPVRGEAPNPKGRKTVIGIQCVATMLTVIHHNTFERMSIGISLVDDAADTRGPAMLGPNLYNDDFTNFTDHYIDPGVKNTIKLEFQGSKP